MMSDRDQFGYISNVQEFTGMHMNKWELTGAHSSTQEIQIISYKGHREFPINSQTRSQLPYAVAVAAVFVFLLLMLRKLFD